MKIYNELEADPTDAIVNEIKKSLKHLHDAGYIDDTELEYLTPPVDTRTQRMYFLKKLHKNPHGIRPIVSGINGPTERLSVYIDHFLKPTLTNIPSLLNNTHELISILETNPIPTDALLVTIDVSNLYLNIPQDEGTNACLDAMSLKKTYLASAKKYLNRHTEWQWGPKWLHHTRTPSWTD